MTPPRTRSTHASEGRAPGEAVTSARAAWQRRGVATTLALVAETSGPRARPPTGELVGVFSADDLRAGLALSLPERHSAAVLCIDPA